jgi:WD40 repeat protein
MTAIFISHRSSDSGEAQALKDWLAQQGHERLFLDFDPDDGLPAGVDWEQRLYRELRRCQALLIVLTPGWLESVWCRSELAIAREKGKAIFVARVKACPTGPVIPALQEADLTIDWNAGLAKLAAGLREHGLDPRASFDWKPDRPIYPGLSAYDIDDAAIFFARSEESWGVVEELRRLRMQTPSSPKLLLIAGASGSGKSSLMRAGVLARLRKEPASWIVAPPFRRGVDAVRALSNALVWAFPADRRPRTPDAVATRLTARDGPDQLLALVSELRLAVDRPDATLAVALDQTEELIAAGEVDDVTRLLDLLRAALAMAGSELLVVATIRSDRLGAWQQHGSIKATTDQREMPFVVVPLAPIPMSRIGEIVRGPAAYEGLRIEDDLVDALRADTATPDALPLLAYTLQHLHRHFAHEAHFTVAMYRSFGGLEGSVRNQADAAIPIATMSEKDIRALRIAFVPGLVRASADGGFTRSRAQLARLPRVAEPYIRRLIDARLLATNRDPHAGETVEVAHESLLRVWPTLVRWIDEEAQNLTQLEAVRRAALDWARAQRAEAFLIHRDFRLVDAEALMKVDHFASAFGDIGREYIVECRTAQDARDAQNRAARDREAAQFAAAQIAQSRFLADRAEQALKAGEPVQAALLGLAGLPDPRSGVERPMVHEAECITWEACQKIRERFALSCGGEVQTAMFSPDSMRVLTVTSDGYAAVWDAKTASLLNKIDDRSQRVTSARFSADGSGILTLHTCGDYSGSLCFRANNLRDINYARHIEGYPRKLLLSHDGAKVLVLTGLSALRSEGDTQRAELRDSRSGNVIALLEGHKHIVWNATFSHDGRYLATVSYDKTARLWDGQTGAGLATLAGHRDQIGAVAFCPDGRLLATGADDKTVRLWNIATGKCVSVLKGPEDAVRNVVFSPDGTHIIATAGHASLVFDKKTHCWDVDTGHVLDGLPGGIAAYAEFSLNGMRLITIRHDTTKGRSHVQLWRTDPYNEVAALIGHGGFVHSVAFSPDGRRIATGSSDGTARIWDTYSGLYREAFPGHSNRGRRVVVSPAGDRLLTISTGAVRLWNIDDGSEVAILRPLGTKVASSKLSFFDRIRSLGRPLSLRQQLNRTDLAVWKTLPTSAFRADIATATFSSDGARFVTASAGGHVELVPAIWDSHTGTKLVELRGHESYVISASFSPDASRVATASMDGTVKLWDARTGALQRSLGGCTGAMLIATFSPDGTLVATSSVNKIVQIWDAASGSKLSGLQGHLAIIFSLAFSPDASRIVTVADDHTARLWDPSTGAEIANLSERKAVPWDPDYFLFFCSYTFSSDGGLIVVGDSLSPNARIYGTRSGNLISECRGHFKTIGSNKNAARISSVHFSPDNSLILTTSDDGTARVWYSSSGASVSILRGHLDDVTDAAFSNNGAHAVTTSRDMTARLWDIATGGQIIVLSGHEGGVSAVAFTQDGSYFVTTSDDGTARIWAPKWEWKTQDIIKITKARVPRQLTSEERKRAYLDLSH